MLRARTEPDSPTPLGNGARHLLGAGYRPAQSADWTAAERTFTSSPEPALRASRPTVGPSRAGKRGNALRAGRWRRLERVQAGFTFPLVATNPAVPQKLHPFARSDPGADRATGTSSTR